MAAVNKLEIMSLPQQSLPQQHIVVVMTHSNCKRFYNNKHRFITTIDNQIGHTTTCYHVSLSITGL